jgi:hypothetical protein
MDPNSILLVTITVLVALMTIGVWGILFALVKSQSGSNAERTAAIRGISEECAEADKVLSSSSAKTMNAHTLRSALAPRIDHIQKMLTANMHLLDVYFVKYTESRLAAFSAILSSSEPAGVFPIDKFLSEAKPAGEGADKQEEGPKDALAQGLEQRLRAEPSPHETVLVKEQDQQEPPAMDLRTGIITVAQEEASPPVVKKPSAAEKAPERLVKRSAAQQPKKMPEPGQAPAAKPAPSPAPSAAAAEEVFDFEKEISAHPRVAPAEYGHSSLSPFGPTGTRGVDVPLARDFQGSEAPDTKILQTDKTMRYDKEELTGYAGMPESIVVEGGEPVKAKAAAPKKTDAVHAPDADRDAKREDAMISGEDIENTLDSFFGLGDK